MKNRESEPDLLGGRQVRISVFYKEFYFDLMNELFSYKGEKTFSVLLGRALIGERWLLLY